MLVLRLVVLGFVLILALAPKAGAAEPDKQKVLNLYSARHYSSDQALYDGFTKASGIDVNLIEGDGAQLISRLENEGRLSPADVFIVVDAGNLWRADQKGFFRAVNSDVLTKRIPAQYRQKDGHWFGFSKRLRVIAASKARVKEGDVKSYDDLAKPRFKGKVCARSSSNVYNLSFLAAMIARRGEAKAEDWAKRVVANFARPPQGGDIDQITAIAAGACDLALVNHYYYVRLATSDKAEDRAAAEKVRLIFPDQSGNGVHTNIGGAGVLKNAPHPGNAVLFLEYLASDDAQRIFAQGNNEFPIAGTTHNNPALAKFGAFKEDKTDVTAYGENQAKAQMIYDRVGWK